MRPEKELKMPAQSERILAFPDFGRFNGLGAEKSLNGRDAPEIFNFSVRRNALSDCDGLTEVLSVERDSVGELYYYRRFDVDAGTRDDRLVFWCRSGKVRQKRIYGNETAPAEIAGLTFDDPPRAVNYRLNGRDVLLLGSDRGLTVLDGASVAEYPDAPDIRSLCVHYERLFVTVGGARDRVWFSDDLDVTNWTVSLEEAGFIELADDGGSVLCALPFADKVYLFRRYSVARLTAYAEQTEFSLRTLYTSNSRLMEHTVCACGDRVLFLAENGLFVFDGVSASRILERYDGFLDYAAEASFACYAGGKYALVCYDRSARQHLLVYDMTTGEEVLYAGTRLDALCASLSERQDGFFAVPTLNSRQVCRLAAGGTCATRTYRSRTVLLNAGRRALVAGFTLDTAQPLTCTVTTDEESQTFALRGGHNEVKCHLRGRELSFSLAATGNGHLVYPPRFRVRSLK